MSTLYCLPGCRTFHELTTYEDGAGAHVTLSPHLKCDPRKKYNDLMSTVNSEIFRHPHPTYPGVGRIFLCGRCFRVPRAP